MLEIALLMKPIRHPFQGWFKAPELKTRVAVEASTCTGGTD